MAPLLDARIGQVVQLLELERRAVGLDLVLEGPDLGRARGQDQVLRRDGVDHVGRREPLRLQRRQIEIDLHLPLLAAVGVGDAGARRR